MVTESTLCVKSTKYQQYEDNVMDTEVRQAPSHGDEGRRGRKTTIIPPAEGLTHVTLIFVSLTIFHLRPRRMDGLMCWVL